MSMSMKTMLAHNDEAAKMRYFDSVRTAKGLNSVWEIDECNDLDDTIPLENMVGRRICYQYIPDSTPTEELISDENCFVEISTFNKGMTWMDLWEAAERLIVQSGTHHRYIEDFEMREDGSLELITGS